MPNSIEINENSLLKLIVRNGYNVDRLQTVLDVGEPGYTLDTKRLYIGDGVTPGGNLAGNLYLGEHAFITSVPGTPAYGDIGFDTGKNTLFVYDGDNPGVLNNWTALGGVYTAENSTILISSNNQIKVGTLSANNLSPDVISGGSLTYNTGRIGLSSTIAVDKINTSTTSAYLSVPNLLNINNINYSMPSSLLNDGVLTTNNSGNLQWTNINTLLSSLSTDLNIGTGLVATVGSVEQSSITLLPGLNINLKNRFGAIGHASIKQNSEITHNVKCTSVTCLTSTNLIGRPVNGQDLLLAPTAYDYVEPKSGGNVVEGLYEFTFDFNLLPTYVYDVRVSNGSYRRPAQSLGIFSPNLETYYWITGTNKIMVALYTTLTYINLSNGVYNAVTGPSYLTPGTANEATRISVTVYTG